MKKIAIITDSNAGISQEEAKKLGITVLPMPFTIDGKTFLKILIYHIVIFLTNLEMTLTVFT